MSQAEARRAAAIATMNAMVLATSVAVAPSMSAAQAAARLAAINHGSARCVGCRDSRGVRCCEFGRNG